MTLLKMQMPWMLFYESRCFLVVEVAMKAMGSMALELREKVGWQPHLLHRLHPHIIDTMTR